VSLETDVTDLKRAVDDLRDDIGGEGGLRERLKGIEAAFAAHDLADTGRHTDLCARVDGARADVAALRALVEQDVRRPGIGLALIDLARTAIQTGGTRMMVILSLTGLAVVGGTAALEAILRGSNSAVMQAVGLGRDAPAALPPALPPEPVEVAP
jgi:hypothetical protein